RNISFIIDVEDTLERRRTHREPAVRACSREAISDLTAATSRPSVTLDLTRAAYTCGATSGDASVPEKTTTGSVPPAWSATTGKRSAPLPSGKSRSRMTTSKGWSSAQRASSTVPTEVTDAVALRDACT